jgi:hypothetical protein
MSVQIVSRLTNLEIFAKLPSARHALTITALAESLSFPPLCSQAAAKQTGIFHAVATRRNRRRNPAAGRAV